MGKTEISRRLAKLAHAPFIKVEATKFTEVGYVGRDVEQIVRDLVEQARSMVREEKRRDVKSQAELAAEERVLDALVGKTASPDTRQSFRVKLREGQLNDKEIELELADTGPTGMPTMDIPGMPGAQMGMINLQDMLGKAFGGQKTSRKKMTVGESYQLLINEESDRLLDDDAITRDAITATEQNGIVFLDEIDKVCAREDMRGGDVSREGVQRDLLPLIEGTSVSTRYGAVKTDHILFIASGAFHLAKPSDLLPELQGRLPIRVELTALNKHDFERILTEPETSLIRQYKALLATEGVMLEFTEDGIAEIAGISADINSKVENIGARRLHTVLERVLDDISFTASDRAEETVTITADYVREHLAIWPINPTCRALFSKSSPYNSSDGGATTHKAPRRHHDCHGPGHSCAQGPIAAAIPARSAPSALKRQSQGQNCRGGEKPPDRHPIAPDAVRLSR
ncbi:ATP-dependent protease ATPase subunit HslU [Kordiimonadales bacterium JCM 17843]|nr:ATP-dependent protease ATPase subunit HslU [Kordiimonadales bacterium JCM 17843]